MVLIKPTFIERTRADYILGENCPDLASLKVSDWQAIRICEMYQRKKLFEARKLNPFFFFESFSLVFSHRLKTIESQKVHTPNVILKGSASKLCTILTDVTAFDEKGLAGPIAPNFFAIIG